MKYPELSDSESAAGLLSTFEEKDELVNLVTESLSEGESKGNEIQVYIGNEAPVQTMKDCSVVTATYDLGEGVKGRSELLVRNGWITRMLLTTSKT